MKREPCMVRWCDESHGHQGDHRQYVGDMAGVRFDGRPSILQVSLQGRGKASERQLVLTVSNGNVHTLVMVWPEVRKLDQLLHRALRERES